MKVMKRLHRLPALLLLAGAALLVAACAPTRIVSKLKIHECGLQYVIPTGSRSFQSTLQIRLHNPSEEFFFDDIHGVIRDGHTQLATVKGERVFIKKHSTHTYDIPCTLTLDKDVSYLDLMEMIAKGNHKNLKLDLYTTVYAGKEHQKMKFKGIKIYEYAR